MDWETYYEKFYDWATSTQISRMSSLTSYGASSEVAEVAQEYMDEKAASRLIKKAVAYGVQFTPEEIYDLSGCCDTSAMNALLEASQCKFNREQLEELWGAVDDDVLEKVAERNHVSLFEDEDDEEDCEDALSPDIEEYYDEPIQPPPISFVVDIRDLVDLVIDTPFQTNGKVICAAKVFDRLLSAVLSGTGEENIVSFCP